MKKQDLIDNASTPGDIAETSELESLRSMREEIQRLIELLKRDLFRERIDFKNTKEVIMFGILQEIKKVVNPLAFPVTLIVINLHQRNKPRG